MLRTNTCGDLNVHDVGKIVKLAGWIQKNRNLGGMTFIDLRDRYGITQLAFDMEINAELCDIARSLGREFVIQIVGEVIERSAKNLNIPTGEIEISVSKINVLNESKLPPFTIENKTDGGEELRMKYRYLDIRRDPIKNNLILRHRITSKTRNYLDLKGFCEIETPYLIKSTPEGARDFIVPSRVNPTQFYALPQSPQTFKQLLMVGGMDKYYQIVKCFRDEDLRSDRQPEFTQIDCEMSFVKQEDVLNTFEGLIINLFKEIKGIELSQFPRITYKEAISTYGTDKPDIRLGMKFVDLTNLCKGTEFNVFNEAEWIIGINVKGGSSFSRKDIDKYTEFIRSSQINAKGLVYCKYNEDGSFKSSVDKFFNQEQLNNWSEACKSSPGDLILIIAGEESNTRHALSELRLLVAENLEIRNNSEFAPIWVVDFPLYEWDKESNRYHSMHHPFTSPKSSDIDHIKNNPNDLIADAYDLVINGNEIGGGSIRIHNKEIQKIIFEHLGFTQEEARKQFGFLMDAFEYGAPPHGGIAFGLDRLCSVIGGKESIRDFIAFPKNNSARDTMIDSPSAINLEQLDDLNLKLKN